MWAAESRSAEARWNAAGSIIEAPHPRVLFLFYLSLTASIQLFVNCKCVYCNRSTSSTVVAIYAFLVLDYCLSDLVFAWSRKERTQEVLYRDISFIMLLYDSKLICTDVKQSTRNVEYRVGINRYSLMQLAALEGIEYIILAFITQKRNYSTGFTFLRCSYSWCPLAYQCNTWLKQHW